jgi:hypothetical protein
MVGDMLLVSLKLGDFAGQLAASGLKGVPYSSGIVSNGSNPDARTKGCTHRIKYG